MHYTEMTFQGRVVEWINEVIKEENLPFDRADQELLDVTGRRPDVVLWEKRKTKPALLIELKRPYEDPWGEALDDAISKAWKTNIPYIATWNVNRFYSWETFGEGDVFDKLWFPHAGVKEEISRIRAIEEVDRVEESLKAFLKKFLKEFADIYYGVIPKPPLATDERFILRLRSTISAISIPVFYASKKRAKEDTSFRRKLRRWFAEQGWIFTASDDDFEKVSRQYVYLLIDKILFYNVLRLKYPLLRKMIMPLGVDGEQFREILQKFFNEGLNIDYETIFSADFLDSISPPDDAIGELRIFVEKLGEYDFSKVNYEILGRVFERLIPEEERHRLGQYFTRPDVVDLIVGFCVKDPDDIVLDPACGAFTFGVRAYYRKKQLEARKRHKELLDEIYGIDIAKFPAHLATINLTVRDLSETENYPKVVCRDFFDVEVGGKATLVPLEYVAESLSKKEFEITLPFFDAVVMNPPYTRQEEMEETLAKEKEKAHGVCLNDWKMLTKGKYVGKEKPKLSKRSSIYVYFFMHGASFLKEDGRLGLITSNSWLDVDYGYDLQRFFLENFKVVAVIESKVERWFEDADINTTITILQRCSSKKARMNNIVKFVQLKKPLNHFIKHTRKEEDRWKTVESIIKRIEEANKYCEEEDIRIFSKKQKELWEEGYDEDEKAYVGSKWGKYIRAPDIFFKATQEGRTVLVQLKKVVEIKRGFTTGANQFFYLPKPGRTNRLFGAEVDSKTKNLLLCGKKSGKTVFTIEKEFWTHKGPGGKRVPNYVVRKLTECKSISTKEEELTRTVLMIHEPRSALKKKNVLKYITWGENYSGPSRLHKDRRKSIYPFPKRPTCASRPIWYDLRDQRPTEIIFPRFWYQRHIVPFNEQTVYVGDVFFAICPLKDKWSKALCAILNSTFFALIKEIYGRFNLGQGCLTTYGPDILSMQVINPKKVTSKMSTSLERALDKMIDRPISTVFEEVLGRSISDEEVMERTTEDFSREVDMNKIASDRRNLDKLVFDILNLSKKERLEVYRGLIEMTIDRTKRALSVQRKDKRIKGIDINSLVKSALEEVGGTLKRFPEDYIGFFEYRTIYVPRAPIEAGSDLQGFYVVIGQKEIRCKTANEAKYIKYAAMNGHTAIKVPLDDNLLTKAVKEHSHLLKDAKKVVSRFIEESIPNKKLRERVKGEVWKRLT
jgi:type I restriction enzyme M protein